MRAHVLDGSFDNNEGGNEKIQCWWEKLVFDKVSCCALTPSFIMYLSSPLLLSSL